MIKSCWDLTVTAPEFAALRDMFDACESPPTLTRIAVAEPAHTPAPATAAGATAMADHPYGPAGPDRECGDFDRWDQPQAFYGAAGGPASDRHRLDRDGDGIACQSLPAAPCSQDSPALTWYWSPGPSSPDSEHEKTRTQGRAGETTAHGGGLPSQAVSPLPQPAPVAFPAPR